MTLEELKKIYLQRGPHDKRIIGWILRNIKKYIRRKSYPPALASEGEWSEAAYQQILDDFVTGREVKDRKTGQAKIDCKYNLPEIFDRCDSTQAAEALIQQQIHFAFQKSHESGINENIARRVKEICKKNPELARWKRGAATTYGLRVWLRSDPGTWDGSETELFHLAYAALGNYVPKVYMKASAYSSPEICSQDLGLFLVNIFSATDKRLTMSQIMFILGYKLQTNETRPISLDEETEKKTSLLETIADQMKDPEEDFIEREDDADRGKIADSFYEDLPDHLRELLKFQLRNQGSLDDFARSKNVPLSTLYDQMKQIRARFGEYTKNPYEQRLIQQKLLEKFSLP